MVDVLVEVAEVVVVVERVVERVGCGWELVLVVEVVVLVEPQDGRVELGLGEAVVWSLEELLEFVVVEVAERHVRGWVKERCRRSLLAVGLVSEVERVNGHVELGQQGSQLRVKFGAFAKFHG